MHRAGQTVGLRPALLSSVLLGAVLATGCGGSTPLAVTSPASTIIVGQTLQFVATGGGKSPLIWSVNSVDGGNATVGTIASGGLYTAPLTPPSPNNITVSARRSNTPSKTASLTVSVTFTPPTLSAITPPTVTADGAGISVTLTGTGFTPATAGLADATALTMTFVSSTEVTALIPGAIASVVSAPAITVSNPAPGGGASSSITLPIFGLGVVTPTNNLQVARYTIETPVDTDVTVEFGLDTSYGTPTWTLQSPSGGGTVEILVAGMKGLSDYHMRASAAIPGGPTHLDEDHTFTTGQLDPATIPLLTVTQHPTLQPTPGLVMIAVHSPTPPPDMWVVNRQGEIVWYYHSDNNSLALGFAHTGEFMSIEGTPALGPSLVLSDLAGDPVRVVYARELVTKAQDAGLGPGAGAFHHDATMLPNGNILLLTRVFKTFTDLVGLEGQVIEVMGDGLVIVDQNLDPIWTWSSFDHPGQLDVNRHLPFGFPDVFGRYDWTHANSVSYNPTDGNIYVSLRSQHWVIKIDYRDGSGTDAILWLLGNEGDFGPFPLPAGSDAADWQYGQHDANVIDTTLGVFRMTLYDNGWLRPIDAAGTPCIDNIDCYSRALMYRIDEGAMTAEVVWEDVLTPPSLIISSTQFLSPDRVIHDSGAMVGGTPGASIREVTFDPTPIVVWQLNIPDKTAYRGTLIPGLYPGVPW